MMLEWYHMFDFHEKRKIRSWVFSKTAILVLVIAVGLLSYSVFERFTALQKISDKREQKEAELQELQQRAAALESDVTYLQQKRGVEEELRSRFDVAKEGEQVVVIVDDEAAQDTDLDALAKPPGANEQRPWWKFLVFWW